MPWPPPRGDRPLPCSPGAPRATPSQKDAAALGFKIGTFPTGTLSPATAGLAALKAGHSEAKSALPPPELRLTLGYEVLEQYLIKSDWLPDWLQLKSTVDVAIPAFRRSGRSARVITSGGDMVIVLP